MKPIIFNSDETEFRTNGLGRIDPVKCLVTEERNGQFELEAVVSIDDPHFDILAEGMILYCRHDDTTDKQPFEIYKIERPIDGKVTIYAHHITYRTSKEVVAPFEAEGITAAFSGLKDNAMGECPFTFWTDKTTEEGTFKVTEPVTLRSRLAGNEGSILDVFGTGEYEWDKFNIKLHLHRGEDTGVVLKYGKNITDIKKTTDATNLWTGVFPFWKGQKNNTASSTDTASSEDTATADTAAGDTSTGGDTSDNGSTEETTDEEVLVMLPEKVLYADNASAYSYKMVIPLDLSSAWQEPPTEEQLRNRAQKYIEANEVTEMPTSIDVSFIALWQTEEYRDIAELQRLRLCDTLTVQYKKLGVKNTAKIIKTVYNVLLERYDSMTIGEAKASLGSYS